MATASDVLDDAGYDFSDLTDDTVEVQEKPASRTRGTNPGAATRRRRASKNKLTELQKQLSGQMFLAGTMIGMALPVTGMYACQESDAFTKAVVDLAATRPEWIAALQHLADIQPGLIIGKTAVGLGAALAVDRRRLSPDKRILKFLGVYQAWQSIYEPGYDEGIEEGSGYVPPPAGAFVPL